MKIQPLDPDTLEGQDRRIYDDLVAVRERNSQRVAEIEAMGGMLDIATARIEHFMSALVSMGVITQTQLLEIHKDWELNMQKQTKKVKMHMQAALAQRAEEMRRAQMAAQGRTEGGLIVPPGTTVADG